MRGFLPAHLLDETAAWVAGYRPSTPYAPRPEVDVTTPADPGAAGRRVRAWAATSAAWVERTLVSKLVTASLHDGVLRVVVFRGSRPIAWRSIPLADEPARTGRHGYDGTAVTALRSALQAMRPGWHRLAVDLPLYAPLSRSFTLKKIGREYLERVVSREVTDAIPFEREEVDLAWQARKAEDGTRILAMAVPKHVSDQLFLPFRQARLHTHFAYAQALSLCLATGVRDGTVVWIDRSSAAIVRASDGAPSAVAEHRLAGGAAADEVESLAKAIAQVAERGDVAATNGSRSHGLRAVRVIGVPGSEALAGEVMQRLNLSLGPSSDKSRVFDPERGGRTAPSLTRLERARPELAEGVGERTAFAVDEYLVNVGMQRARMKSVVREGFLAPSLVPGRYLPWRLPLQPIAAFVGLSLLAISASNLTPAVQSVEAEVLPLRAQTEKLARDQRTAGLQLRRVGLLQGERIEVRTLAEGLEAYNASAANVQAQRRNRIIAITTYEAVDGVQVSSIDESAQHFTLSGNAASYDDVLRYASHLRDSAQFASVDVLDMASSSSGEPGQDGAGAGTAVRFRIQAGVGSN